MTIDFNSSERVKELSWKEFFDIFENENLMMEYEIDDVINSDERNPNEKYDFMRETRDDLKGSPETEMDDPQVRSNTEETSV